MLCKLSQLKAEHYRCDDSISPFDRITPHKLVDYGCNFHPLLNEYKKIVSLLRSIKTEYGPISKKSIDYYIFVAQYEMFTKSDITITEKRYQELFCWIKMDIIDIETKPVYGMIRTNCSTFDNDMHFHGNRLYLIPKIPELDNKSVNDMIEKCLSNNLQIESLLEKINLLEEKLIQLEYAPHSVFQKAQQHFEESLTINNS